jgi:hypothetical protein
MADPCTLQKEWSVEASLLGGIRFIYGSTVGGGVDGTVFVFKNLLGRHDRTLGGRRWGPR